METEVILWHSVRDSVGNSVPATFDLEADNLVVAFSADSTEFEYPMISTFDVLPQYTLEDFFYGEGSDFFTQNPSYTFGFTYHNEGVRLNLYPNKLADGWYLGTLSSLPNVVRDTSWYTVTTYFGMGLDFYNLQGMYEQYECHLHFAWPFFMNEVDWNLEQWRPCVGLVDTVAASCNP